MSMADEEVKEDSEQTQAVTISGPVDVVSKTDGDAVLAGVNKDGKPESVEVSGGELVVQTLLTGKDPSLNKRVLLVDPYRILRVRPYEPYRTHVVVALGGGWATAYTCPANTIDKVTVRFGQTALGTTDFTAALRVNGLVIGIGFPIYVDAPPPIFGPFNMAATEIIEVHRVAGLLGAVSFDIERYSTGDQNTGV